MVLLGNPDSQPPSTSYLLLVLGNTSCKECFLSFNFVTFEDIKDRYLVEKWPKHSGKARKKTFFFYRRCSLTTIIIIFITIRLVVVLMMVVMGHLVLMVVKSSGKSGMAPTITTSGKIFLLLEIKLLRHQRASWTFF